MPWGGQVHIDGAAPPPMAWPMYMELTLPHPLPAPRPPAHLLLWSTHPPSPPSAPPPPANSLSTLLVLPVAALTLSSPSRQLRTPAFRFTLLLLTSLWPAPVSAGANKGKRKRGLGFYVVPSGPRAGIYRLWEGVPGAAWASVGLSTNKFYPDFPGALADLQFWDPTFPYPIFYLPPGIEEEALAAGLTADVIESAVAAWLAVENPACPAPSGPGPSAPSSASPAPTLPGGAGPSSASSSTLPSSAPHASTPQGGAGPSTTTSSTLPSPAPHASTRPGGAGPSTASSSTLPSPAPHAASTPAARPMRMPAFMTRHHQAHRPSHPAATAPGHARVADAPAIDGSTPVRL